MFDKHPIISFFLVIFLLGLGGLAVKIIWFPVQMASDAIDVAHKEFGPKEALRKYESFKDMAASMDKQLAGIKVYEVRLASAEKRGGNDRANIERITLIETELSGMKMAYNSLAAEYNSAMSKFNYRFSNVGDLPTGAVNPLPREYKPYITE